MYHIVIVEDEIELNDILKIYLNKEGFHVTAFTNLTEARSMLNKKINLWILDIMLQDGNGFEFLREIKLSDKNTPVILISARGDDLDRVLGLEMGSDDYIAKPFLPRELILRSKNILERFNMTSEVDTNLVKVGRHVIDLKRRLITFEGEPIDLTSHEYDTVLYFINNKSIALSRDSILNNVWGSDFFGSDRVVDNTIKKIRKKMPFLNLETIYGYGYRCNI